MPQHALAQVIESPSSARALLPEAVDGFGQSFTRGCTGESSYVNCE
ncbi:MAG: hypothetical protein ACLFSG_00555 [Halothiobacillaceae bacterium]